MEKNIVILAKSRKSSGFCVGGIDLQTNQFIRLVSEANDNRYNNSLADQDLLYSDGTQIKVLDIVKLKVDKSAPCEYQSENFVIDVFAPKTKLGVFSPVGLQQYLSDDDFIYFNNKSKLSKKTEVDGIINKSIGVYKIEKLHTYLNSNNKMRANFVYKNNVYENISVTDMNYSDKPTEIKEAIVVVTLAEPFSVGADVFCYKILAHIFDISNADIEELIPSREVVLKISKLENELQKLKPFVDSYDNAKNELKQLLLQEFTDTNTKKYKGDTFVYSHVPGKTRKILDASKTKKILGDRYEECLKDVVYKETVSFKENVS